jgi:hypothetical protein
MRVASFVTNVLAPLQGFFFPYNCSRPTIDDYHSLFGDPLNPSTRAAARIRLTAPLAWGGVTTSDALAELVHYRVNRLYELLTGYGIEYDRVEPDTSYRLQLYIDAHIPLAIAMNGSLENVYTMPLIPCADSMGDVSEHVARAVVSYPSTEGVRRNCKRRVTLAHIMRWTLPREMHQPYWDCKTRSFKTLSSDFAEFFKSGGDLLHEVVLCSLLGNYRGVLSRPNWEARMRLYTCYIDSRGSNSAGWLHKCDYIIYYALREVIIHLVPNIIALNDSIRNNPILGATWVAHEQDTHVIMDRVRSVINEYYGMRGLEDVNDTLRNRHNRIGRSSSTEVKTAAQPPLVWSGGEATALVGALLARSLSCADERVLPLMHEALPLVPSSEITNDVARGAHLQRVIRKVCLPRHYAEQLHRTLRRGPDVSISIDGTNVAMRESPCVSSEDARLRCMVYVCPCCLNIMNNVIDPTTSIKELTLRYRHIVRIDINDDTGAIDRYCDECLRKHPGVSMPLIEVALFEPRARPSAWAVSLHDRSLLICPKCTLIVNRMHARFGVDGDEYMWGCLICTPRV